MRKEYILTDEEKARKRQKIEENKYAATKSHCTVDTQAARLMRDLERQGIVHRNEVSSQTRMMSEQDQADIEEVVSAYQSSLSINMEKDFPREQANSMSDLVNIAELSVRRVISMAKQMKNFRCLPQTDQIALLKGGSIELLILRSVVSFDKEKQQFLDMNDAESEKALRLEQFKKAETGTGLFEEHMKFVKNLAIDIGADQTTLLLLLVISLFSPDRDNLKEKTHVSAQQERYSMLLQNYLEAVYSYSMAHTMLPRLLMKLTDIRNLNEEHSQVLLKVNPEGIQPLMKEVLDITH
jgi:nuclear receptor subfamily 1 group I